MFFRCLKADFMKTKHLTSIRVSHILIPISAAVVFLAYYTYAPWDAKTKVEVFFQILGIGMPFLIGLFCVLVAEQESAAGAYQGMLSVTKRYTAYFSKIVLLLSLGLFALLLVYGLFGIGYFFWLKQTFIKLSFYWLASLIFIGSNILIYVSHLFLAFKFNKGVSIGLGIVESLLSALLITGMGNHIWIYIPCAWASRFTEILLQSYIGTVDNTSIMECKIAITVCIALTILALIISAIWFCQWDGHKNND